MKKNVKAILANIVWMIFDKVFILLLNLLVTVKVANFFGMVEYGRYEYTVSIIAIIEILVTFVDGRTVKRRYLEYNPDIVVFNATISRILFSFVSCIIGIIFIVLNSDKISESVFVILLLEAIIKNLRFGMVNRFEYELKSKKTVIAADISAFLGSCLQLAAVSYNCTILSIAIIALTTSAINLIIIFIQYKKEFSSYKSTYVDKQMIKGMVGESVPLAIAASCAIIYSKCDSVMIGSQLTVAEVGIYAIAAKLISVVQIAITPIRESVYPTLLKLYKTDKEKYEIQYIKISSILTWVYIAGVLFSFLILPYCFRVLKTEYLDALPVYRIYVLGTLFMYNAGLRAGHYTMIHKGSILMYAQTISLLVNIVLNFVGIGIWGIYGAAFATVCTQCISLMISNIFFGEEGRKVFCWQLKAFNPVYILK